MFPLSLVDLSLSIKKAWIPNTFPKNLKILRLPNYKGNLEKNMIPSCLEQLFIFKYNKNKLTNEILPLTLTNLAIGCRLKRSCAMLFTNLTDLDFFYSHRFKSNDFPPNLEKLSLWGGYAHEKLISFEDFFYFHQVLFI